VASNVPWELSNTHRIMEWMALESTQHNIFDLYRCRNSLTGTFHLIDPEFSPGELVHIRVPMFTTRYSCSMVCCTKHMAHSLFKFSL